MLFTVNVSSQGLVSILTSIISLQDTLQCLKSLFRVLSYGFLSYLKKRKISQNDHSLSVVLIRCHSLSFAVTDCHSLSLVFIHCYSLSFVVSRCLSLYHSLFLVVPLVVARCHSLYHSFSLDVSLVCLFISDRYYRYI